MPAITTKQFNLLTDVNLAWDFLVEVYDANRVEAPYFEYAITESWMNKDYLHLCRFWLDGEKVVGFVFHENPVTSLHFALRPGYENLAEDMIAYAAGMLPASFGLPEFALADNPVRGKGLFPLIFISGEIVVCLGSGIFGGEVLVRRAAALDYAECLTFTDFAAFDQGLCSYRYHSVGESRNRKYFFL